MYSKWFLVIKNEIPSVYWEKVRDKFTNGRNLGYVMSYWYLQNKEEIENWVDSQSNLKGVFIDTGDRSKTYKVRQGGYFIYDDQELQKEISENEELLQKYNIPLNVEGLVNSIATQKYDNADIYNFIADQFGDRRRRRDNPLGFQQRRAMRDRQRGFE